MCKAHWPVGVGYFHGESLDQRRGQFLAFGAIQERSPLNLSEQRQQQVVLDGVFQDKALGPAVFGDEGHACIDCLLWRGKIYLFAAKQDLAAVNFVNAEERTGKLGPSAAHQSCQAEDFARAEREGHVPDPVAGIEPAHFQ